jgi:hypothetical protein
LTVALAHHSFTAGREEQLADGMIGPQTERSRPAICYQIAIIEYLSKNLFDVPINKESCNPARRYRRFWRKQVGGRGKRPQDSGTGVYTSRGQRGRRMSVTIDKFSPSGTEAESPLLARPEHVPDRTDRQLAGTSPSGPEEALMPKHRKRLSLEWEKVARLLITAIEPVTKLIDAISRLR